MEADPVYFVVALQPRDIWKKMQRDDRERFINDKVRPAFEELFVAGQYGVLTSVRSNVEGFKDSVLLIYRLAPTVTKDRFQRAFRESSLSSHFVPHWDITEPTRPPEDEYATLLNLPTV